MLYIYFYHSCRSLILLALGTGSIYMGKITECGAFSSCTSLAVHRRFYISALQCITNSALAYRKRGRMDLLLDCSHGLSIRSSGLHPHITRGLYTWLLCCFLTFTGRARLGGELDADGAC
ncbi:hypothetical protein BDV09DRAFT_27371 [Aspergillus tetrazonus]